MRGLILVLFILSFTGCYSVRYVAPPNQDVKVMTETEYGKIKTTKRVWYLLDGLIPMTDNSTADVIRRYDLKNVKVESKITVLDALICGFTWGIICSITLEIEGEVAK
jgi:hypothetical protein